MNMFWPLQRTRTVPRDYTGRAWVKTNSFFPYSTVVALTDHTNHYTQRTDRFNWQLSFVSVRERERARERHNESFFDQQLPPARSRRWCWQMTITPSLWHFSKAVGQLWNAFTTLAACGLQHADRNTTALMMWTFRNVIRIAACM